MARRFGGFETTPIAMSPLHMPLQRAGIPHDDTGGRLTAPMQNGGIDRPWFVYLLLCRGERIYCGVTPDLQRRIGAHRRGKGAKFTRTHPPERLLAVKSCAGKVDAMQLEARIKRMRRPAKLTLVETWLRDEPLDEWAARCFPDLTANLVCE